MRNTRMLTGWATFPFPSEVQEVFLDNAALDLQDADLKTRRNLSRPAYDIKLHSEKSVKIGHNTLYDLKEFFRIHFLQVFYQYFEFYILLHCVLELTETSIKLMDNVVCNELPVLFLLFHGFNFYSVSSFCHCSSMK